MKNRLTVISIVGTLCFAGAALAQNTAQPLQGEMPKMASTAPPSQDATVKSKSNITNNKQAGALSAQDKAFIQKAATGGNMEVQWGQWAAQNGQNPDVKKFGNRMVGDHSKANKELMALAQKKNATIKTEKVKGKWTSDKDYMEMMVKDHQGDWAEFQAEAKNGTDPDLKKFAADTSKMIQKHLELAKQTQSKLK
jgi:putative membrane protein